MKKRVTMINGVWTKTFHSVNDTIQVTRKVSTETIFAAYPKTFPTKSLHHTRNIYKLKSTPPYRDFHHFKEYFKPWVALKRERKDHGPHELWFNVLRDVNERYGLGIDVDDVEHIGFRKPNLGLYPTFNMVEAMRQHGDKKEVAEALSYN